MAVTEISIVQSTLDKAANAKMFDEIKGIAGDTIEMIASSSKDSAKGMAELTTSLVTSNNMALQSFNVMASGIGKIVEVIKEEGLQESRGEETNTLASDLVLHSENTSHYVEEIYNFLKNEADMAEVEKDRISFNPLEEDEERKEIDPSGGILDMFSLKNAGGFMNKLGTKLLKGGIIAGLGKFTYDLYDIYNDDDRIRQITGNTEGAIEGYQRSSATIAGALSKLTFGLVDAQTIYALINKYIKGFQEFLDDVFDGILYFEENFKEAFSFFSDGRIVDGITKVGETIIGGFTGLVGYVNGIFNKIFDMDVDFIDLLVKAEDFIFDKIMSLGMAVAGFVNDITPTIKNTFTGFIDSVVTYFKEHWKELLIPGYGLAKSFGKSDVVDGVFDSVASFFTGDAKAEPVDNREEFRPESLRISEERLRDERVREENSKPVVIQNINNSKSSVTSTNNSLTKNFMVLGT